MLIDKVSRQILKEVTLPQILHTTSLYENEDNRVVVTYNSTGDGLDWYLQEQSWRLFMTTQDFTNGAVLDYAWLNPFPQATDETLSYGFVQSNSGKILKFFQFDQVTQTVVRLSENLFKSEILRIGPQTWSLTQFLQTEKSGQLFFLNYQVDDLTQISLSKTPIQSDIKAVSVSEFVGTYFAASDGSGTILLFNFDQLIANLAEPSAPQLGQYLWLSSDDLLSQPNQLVIAASTYSTELTRMINLYKIVNSKIVLWQPSILEINLADIQSLTIKTGTIMYIQSATQSVVTMRFCSENQFYSIDSASCSQCNHQSGTLWMQQTKCDVCNQIVANETADEYAIAIAYRLCIDPYQNIPITVVQETQELTPVQNQAGGIRTEIIILIGCIGILVLLCVTPITLYFIKRHREQKELKNKEFTDLNLVPDQKNISDSDTSQNETLQVGKNKNRGGVYSSKGRQKVKSGSIQLSENQLDISDTKKVKKHLSDREKLHGFQDLEETKLDYHSNVEVGVADRENKLQTQKSGAAQLNTDEERPDQVIENKQNESVERQIQSEVQQNDPLKTFSFIQ